MKLFFEPDTVALIGASASEHRPGNQLFRNLETSFGDRFYPVNPRLERIGDRVCYRSILDVPARIDVAVIFIPAHAVPDALAHCAEKGIRRVIIESSGFAEVGSKGEALQDQCRAIGKEAGMRVWGPNCMGAINVHQRKVLSFMVSWNWHGVFTAGPVSLVVQSGMLSAGFLTHTLSRTPFGLSKVCSIGNKMDVDEIDIFEYLVDDPETHVIAMYLESMTKGRRFLELVRSTHKPIVVLKAGRTSFGREAAISHTSALAQDDRVLDAALRQANVIRVYGMAELMEVARCLGVASVKTTSKARVAVLTFSGGGGVVTADDIADTGMVLASLAPQTLSEIKEVFPEWMDPSNPVDLYPAFEKNGSNRALRQAIEAVMKDPGVDAVYAHLYGSKTLENIWDYDHMALMMQKYEKPIVVWVLGPMPDAKSIRQEIERLGIPTVEDMRSGVRVLAALTMRR